VDYGFSLGAGARGAGLGVRYACWGAGCGGRLLI